MADIRGDLASKHLSGSLGDRREHTFTSELRAGVSTVAARPGHRAQHPIANPWPRNAPEAEARASPLQSHPSHPRIVPPDHWDLPRPDSSSNHPRAEGAADSVIKLTSPLRLLILSQLLNGVFDVLIVHQLVDGRRRLN